MMNIQKISSRHEQLEVRFGGRRIATIRLKSGKIVWRIDEEAANVSGFTSTQLHCFVSRLIDAPLERRRRRKKALPHLFREIMPNSTEHYLELMRDCGPFSVVPLPMP